MKTGRKTAYLKYILSLVIFGSNGILARWIDLPSNQIVMYRTLIGSLVLLGFFAITRQHFTFYRHKKDSIFMLLSGVSTGLSWIFLYEAYRLIGVGVSSLAYYTGPVIVMALSPLIFKEKLTAVKTVSFITVLAGIILLSIQAVETGASTFGITCGILSAVFYAGMIIFNKKAVNIKGTENSILQLAISCVTVALYTFIRQGTQIQIPSGSILPLLALGIINTGIGCALYFSTIGELSVTSVSILGYLEPLSAVIMSVIILKESMTLLQIIGAIFIIMGALLSEVRTSHTVTELKIQKDKRNSTKTA